MPFRIKKSFDFKRTTRTGYRFNSPHLVVHVFEREDGGVARLGVVVSKAVGNAVKRNLIKRRLKNIFFETGASAILNLDIVARVKPKAAQAENADLKTDFVSALNKAGYLS